MRPNVFTVASPGQPSGELSKPKAADLLQMNQRGISLLLDSGYLPDLEIGRIMRLAGRSILATDGNQPVLRQAAARPAPVDERSDPSGRRRAFVGDSAQLSDIDVVEADRMWWRSDPDTVCEAELLPVTLAGFPVTVLKILGADGGPDRVVRPKKAGGSREFVEVRHAYKAELAGRVRQLGSPELDYIAPNLSPAEQETVRIFLESRSTARSGGPIAYLPKRP